MTIAEVVDLYDYDVWANARLLGASRALASEAFMRDLGSSFRSVQGTFAHLVSGEWIWLERWQGRNPSAVPEVFAAPSLEEIGASLADVERRRAEWLAGLDEAALARTLSYTYLSGKADAHPLRDLLVHVANHSTYHRGQVITLLRQLGAAAPSTDYVVWRAERRA